MSDRREEIDFLMETEYSLQSQLERVQGRLAELLEASGAFPAQTPSEPPRYRSHGNLIVLRATAETPDDIA